MPGICRNSPSSSHSTSLRAVGHGEERIGRLAISISARPRCRCRRSRADLRPKTPHAMPMSSSTSLSWRGSSASSTDRDAALARRDADLAHERREAIVGDHRIGIRHQRGGIVAGAPRSGARRGNSTIARSPRPSMEIAEIDEVTPSTRGQADAVDVLARRQRQQRVADGVDAGRPAERTCEARTRAEMRDRDRGIRARCRR